MTAGNDRWEMFRALVLETRSVRRFDEKQTDLARQTASGGNKQPLKYVISWTAEKNAAIFPHLHWAAYLKDGKPAEGERPAAYILILLDRDIANGAGCDHGIAAQTLMVGARAMGLGGCILGAVDRGPIRAAIGLPDRYEILLVVALGKPREKVVLEPVVGQRIEYWRDAEGVHHVPKRSLDEVLLPY
jgi:nitroreductase